MTGSFVLPTTRTWPTSPTRRCAVPPPPSPPPATPCGATPVAGDPRTADRPGRPGPLQGHHRTPGTGPGQALPGKHHDHRTGPQRPRPDQPPRNVHGHRTTATTRTPRGSLTWSPPRRPGSPDYWLGRHPGRSSSPGPITSGNELSKRSTTKPLFHSPAAAPTSATACSETTSLRPTRHQLLLDKAHRPPSPSEIR